MKILFAILAVSALSTACMTETDRMLWSEAKETLKSDAKKDKEEVAKAPEEVKGPIAAKASEATKPVKE